jgi:hypothetical protein
MKRSVLFITIFAVCLLAGGTWLAISSTSSLASENIPKPPPQNADGSAYREIPNNAFSVGEKLTFDISYGIVHAGEAIMTIPDIKYLNGRKAYETLVLANSYSSFDWIFKVRDRYATYLDVDGIFPWRFEQHVREGSYSHDYDAFFDPIAKTAETSDGNKYSTPQYVHDIVSAFYYLRTCDLQRYHKGDQIQLVNFFDGKTNPLTVLVLGHQRISVDAGTFNCVVVEPEVVQGGLFKNEGSIRIWMTDDANHMPVRMSSKILIGSIDASLTKYEGVRGALTARVSD